MSRPAPRRPRALRGGVPGNPKKQGELAELAFLHKAGWLGFVLSKPYGDSARYDFIVDAGGRLSRVQVKSASVCRDNAYKICSGRGHSSKRGYTARDIDFLAAYVFPCDAWYIIPVRALRRVMTLQVAPHFPSRRRFEPFREAWRLLTTRQGWQGPQPARRAQDGSPRREPWVDDDWRDKPVKRAQENSSFAPEGAG